MPDTDIKDFSTTAADNSTVGGIAIADNSLTPGLIDNAFRATLAVLAGTDFGTKTVKADTIAESTADTGVTIDGLLIKDGDIPDIQAVISALLPVGVQMPYGGDTAPTNWLLCDGSAVSRTTYSDLFAALGVKYGVGDGSTTFNVPDKRGRGSIGAGTGAGLTARTVGDTGGEEEHILLRSELPNESLHTVRNTSTVTGSANVGANEAIVEFNNFGTASNYYLNGSPGVADVGATDPLGDGDAHNVMSPYEVDNWIIYAGA